MAIRDELPDLSKLARQAVPLGDVPQQIPSLITKRHEHIIVNFGFEASPDGSAVINFDRVTGINPYLQTPTGQPALLIEREAFPFHPVQLAAFLRAGQAFLSAQETPEEATGEDVQDS